jgi:DNA-binding beta-propeller fold protein YncE
MMIIPNITIALILIVSNCFSLSVGNRPTTLIRAENASGLDRPEGVAFTPSGDYVVVTNSLADSITFYKRLDEKSPVYETTPSFSIQGPQSQLNYPHDLSFSPDGMYLAVANRHSNAITIYKKNLPQNCYASIPIATIGGVFSQIGTPDAVRYSPIENIIVVANMASNSLTFYYYRGDQYDQQPYQVIRNSNLIIPDGLDFSRRGELLAVTSHDTHSVLLFQRKNSSQGLYTENPIQILQGEETHFCYPHSLTFHPLKNYLAVSSSQGRKNVNIFSNGSETTYSNTPELSLEIIEMYDESTIALLDQLMQEGGVKGIAFSPDGKSLAIVQNLCQDTLRLPTPVGVLAIYPLDLLNSN